MQLKKRRILKTDSDFPIINFQQSHTSSSKPIIQFPPILMSPTTQKQNSLSFHQNPNKSPKDTVSSQNFQTFRKRSITLNKKNLSQFIQPIELQGLSKQLFVHQQKFSYLLEKTQQEQQQSRVCINKIIQTEKNQPGIYNRKMYLAFNSLNNRKQHLIFDQLQSKNKNNFQQEQSFKKSSFQCFKKIIPKYHSEYNKQQIQQQAKFLEIGNCQSQDQQQKCQTDYDITLNMSEIQEMNEDGLSSIAQSTFCNKVC
ncbi:unnamed protein product [Paramecium sonneborni]|uniref:Uncharacterized protein n=1 Tax=Paramecium sonneborni TaxID=65129 RepID=A0A8S1NMJ1_9CILI|nr:unnamed protein product [Paramecium sonneborni]